MSTHASATSAAVPTAVHTSGNGKGKAIPGSRTPGWLQTAQFLARPDVFLERNWRQHGDVFSAHIHGFGTGRQVVLADPELIEKVFKGSARTYRLGEVGSKFFTALAGPKALLGLDGDEHLDHRKLMLPPFHGERMRAYAGIVAEATDRSLADWPIGEPFPLRPRMVDITLETILRAVFGLERGKLYDEMRSALLALVANDNIPNLLAVTFPPLRRDFGPLRAWSSFQRTKAHADALVYKAIAARRQAPDLGEREDILSMLILAQRKDGTSLTDSELHDELITMLLAGHETTATALSWTFDLLLHEPAVLARLREDLQSGSETYLEAVVNEALRLRPVVATSQRVLKATTELGGYRLPSGVTILSAIWLVHRRPELYPEPLAFRPERFLQTRPGTYTWIPFGGGVRRCIGANFAPMEICAVLKRVLAQAELAPASQELERPQNRVVLLAPKRGTMVIRHA